MIAHPDFAILQTLEQAPSIVEGLRAADIFLLRVFNHQLQNPLLDAVLPAVTNYIKTPLGLALAIGVWLFLLTGCGRNGRIAAILIVPTVAFSDNFTSDVIKPLFDRPRPCHTLPDLRVLVHCGLGYSFPSTHAVNNFAWTAIVSYHLPKWAWGTFPFAALVSFSRVYLGVHYPSDVLAGAALGLLCAAFVLWLHAWIAGWLRRRRLSTGDRAAG